MKKLLIFALLLLPVSALAQTATDKFPAEATNIRWPYAVSDEPKISGFRIYSSPIQSGPFTTLQGTVAPSLRVFTFPAAFPSGTVKVYYVVRPFLTTPTGTTEASDSNSVEVEMRVPTVTGVTVN